MTQRPTPPTALAPASRSSTQAEPQPGPRALLRRACHHSRITLFSILILALPLALSLAGVAESSRRLLLVLLGFSGIIFVHELGHFIVARLCSVRCEVFSIGIGPRMLGWKKGVGLSFGTAPEDRKKKKKDKPEEETAAGAVRGAASFGDLEQTAHTSKPGPHAPASTGETDYRVSWLPLGGYVRMLGQDDMDPTKQSSDPRSFNRRPIWQRMAIVSAGVIMNMITALIIFSIIFHPGIGVKFPPGLVGPVAYNSPAARAGLRMGDQIVAIDGEKPLGFLEFTDVMIASALSRGTDDITLTVVRPGESQPLTIKARPTKLPSARFLAIGVQPMPSLSVLSATDEEWEEIVKLHEKYGEGANLKAFKPNDVIVEVDGKPMPSNEEGQGYVRLAQALRASEGKPLSLTVTNPRRATPGNPEGRTTIQITPELAQAEIVGDLPGILGMHPRVRIMATVKDNPAARAGIMPNDVVVKIGSLDNPSIKEFRDSIEASPESALSIVVRRNDEEKTFSVTPYKEKTDDKRVVGRIGVEPGPDYKHAVVTRIEDKRLEETLPRGATITRINDRAVSSFGDIFAATLALPDAGDLRIDYTTRDGTAGHVVARYEGTPDKPDALLASVKAPVPAYVYNMGVRVDNLMWVQKADGVVGAARMGFQHTRKFMIQTYLTLRGLFIRTVSPKELHGIVGIAKVGHDIQERGHVHLWFILAVVSVNLAVANFLPLPIVDGGLFLLLILEKLRGRPLSLKVQSAIQIVGIVALAGLFLFVTYNDILFVAGFK